MAEHDSASTVTIQLPPLPSELRKAFVRFYEDALNGCEPNASAFDVVALPYFDEKGGYPGSVDQFFNAFTPLWNHRLARGEWAPASAVWAWALRPALAWESTAEDVYTRERPSDSRR